MRYKRDDGGWTPKGLTLTRTLGTGLRISVGGEDVEVFLTEIKGSQIRLCVMTDKKNIIDRLTIDRECEARP